MKKFIAFISLLLVFISAHGQTPNIKGQWTSEALENNGPVYATRTFTLTNSQWRVVYHAYADEQGQLPLFTIKAGGFYVIGDASTLLDGVYEGVFPANHRFLTADSAAGVQMFANMGCSLTQGKQTALLNQGCGFVPGLMQAMGEYDLIAIRDGQLFFGDRAGDLTKTRPLKLTPYPLVRSKPLPHE
ncbi:MAG: hypothetical protein WAU37_06385 [Formosimonas sp.]